MTSVQASILAEEKPPMLRKVTILIQQNLLPGLQLLSDSLQEHDVEVVITKPDDEVPKDETPDTGTLYITDSEAAYHALRQQSKYVLPYRHEGNHNSDFAGALYVIEQIEEIGYETIDMAYRRMAGLPWEILTTERCVIRETTIDDVDSFYKIYADPEITKYMEDLYEDRDEEIAYIRDYREKVYGFYGYGMWTVLTKEGTVIGRAGISWREGFDLPELGFVIGVSWQGQGYAYEVCSAILGYAREELCFEQVQVLVMEGNDISENLCRKLGFRFLEKVTVEGNIYERMVRSA